MALSNCEFIDCSLVDPIPDLYTTAALTPSIANLILSVSVVQLNEYPNRCFRVVKPTAPIASALPYTIISTFQDGSQVQNCETCSETIIVYTLTNCLDPESILYTVNSQFAQAVDLVVNLVGYEGECWTVTQGTFEEQEIDDLEILANEQGVLQIFDDCECCLPAPEPTPVKYTRVIPKPDRHFYQVTQSQCDIEANIKFAEGYYRLFKNLKYGINSMCDNIDLNRVWIKKALSDLAVINDPTACTITTPVTPVVCPEPSGNPFVPPVPTTYLFTVGETEIGQGTLGCSTCLDGTLPGPGLVCPAFNISLSYDILDGIDLNATYVFSFNGGCVITLGSFIAAGETEGFPTYTMTEADIVNAGVSPEDPCASCAG